MNSMQLCCNYQLMELMEKREMECIYFDANNNCSGKRMKEISENLVSMYPEYDITSKQILKHITIYYPNDLLSLLSNIIALEKESKRIQLIVIDSLPLFYKKTTYDTAIKLQTLVTLIQHLTLLSSQKYCAIVVVNHLTTKEINRNYTDINYQLTKEFQFSFTKSLGVSFCSYSKLFLYLFHSTDGLHLLIHSSFSLENHILPCAITENGFE